MYFICHITTHHHLIEGSCKFMAGNFGRYATSLVVLVTINIVIVEIMFSVCHLTSSEHMVKGLCEYVSGLP